jgi:hypothetical protein
MDDEMAEQMAEDINVALEPIHDLCTINGELSMSYEQVELNLMKLLDKWYAAGFKEGVADERYTREMSELQDE